MTAFVSSITSSRWKKTEQWLVWAPAEEIIDRSHTDPLPQSDPTQQRGSWVQCSPQALTHVLHCITLVAGSAAIRQLLTR